MVDLKSVAGGGLHVVVDAMHGAGAGYLPRLLGGESEGIREIRSHRNPAFPDMHNPEPVARNLAPLAQAVSRSGADVGLALDGENDLAVLADQARQVRAHLEERDYWVTLLLEEIARWRLKPFPRRLSTEEKAFLEDRAQDGSS